MKLLPSLLRGRETRLAKGGAGQPGDPDLEEFVVQPAEGFGGIVFRRSKDLDDWHELSAWAGETVRGHLEDGGLWLRVRMGGEALFLPTRIAETTVLIPMEPLVPQVRPDGAAEQIVAAVKIVAAKGLKNRDRVGRSDPYCELLVNGVKKGQTTVKWNDLNPQWDNVIAIEGLRPWDELEFKVWDDDRFLPGQSMEDHRDSLGSCKLPLPAVGEKKDEWLTVVGSKDEVGNSGKDEVGNSSGDSKRGASRKKVGSKDEVGDGDPPQLHVVVGVKAQQLLETMEVVQTKTAGSRPVGTWRYREQVPETHHHLHLPHLPWKHHASPAVPHGQLKRTRLNRLWAEALKKDSDLPQDAPETAQKAPDTGASPRTVCARWLWDAAALEPELRTEFQEFKVLIHSVRRLDRQRSAVISDRRRRAGGKADEDPGWFVGQDLGVQWDSQTLRINAVLSGGLVQEWNVTHPDHAMKAGDRIVEVNGIRNDVQGMLNECNRNNHLHLMVQPLRVNKAVMLGNALGAKAAVALAKAVPAGRLESLQRLSLGQCEIVDDGAKALASAMEEGGLPLVRLGLEGNEIGDEGAKAIARAVRSGGIPKLRCLDLEGNQIGDIGARALAEAMAEAPEIRELWVHGNKFQAAGRDALRNAWAPRDPVNLWL